MQKKVKIKILVFVLIICVASTCMPVMAFGEEEAAEPPQTEREIPLDDDSDDEIEEVIGGDDR